MLRFPVWRSTMAISACCSEACVCTRIPCRRRQRSDFLEQVLRARDGEPRRERRADAATGGTVPPAVKGEALVDCAARGLEEPAGHGGVGVHQALADDGPDADGGDFLEHGIRVVHRLHRQDGRGAAREQLAGRQARRGPQRGGRVRRLHRPDPRAEPVDQGEVVGVSAEQRLAQVDVGLDEAGQHERAGGVEHRVAGRRGPRRPPTRCGRP